MSRSSTHSSVDPWAGSCRALFSLGFQSIGLFADKNNSLAAMTGIGIGSVAMIILLPLFLAIFLFIWSALAHLCLMIVGGANQPFETTFRVLAFTQGSTGPLQIIPICGGLIAGVWGDSSATASGWRARMKPTLAALF